MRIPLASLAALVALPHLAAQVDVVRYDLRVELRATDLAVATSIEATGKRPAEWRLELAPQMKATAAECDGTRVPFATEGHELVLDLARAAPTAHGSFTVSIRCEGAPSERFSSERGGFERTAIAPQLAYVRSQVPWYPRVTDDPALHTIVVDAPAGWQVRSAGEFAAPAPKGARAVWTFATATAIDRAGLAAAPWKLVTAGRFDALVTGTHEQAATALLAVVQKAVAFHASDLGPLARARYSLVEMPASFGKGSGYSECGYILLGPGAFDAGPGADWVRGFLAHEAAHQWWGQDGLFVDFANEALAEYSTLRCVRATAGAEAAERLRAAATARLQKAVAGGKSVALGAIRGWGGDLDPETYRVHAYEKGMLLLAAVEDAAGAEPMQACLRQFLGTARARRVGWSDLREALCALGPAAKATVEAWERPGLPGGAPAQGAAAASAKASLERGMKVANSPKQADPKVLAQAIAALRAAQAAPELSGGEKAAAQTGIGRCLFRLGKLDEAQKEPEAALVAGAGGPFHRGWAELRLGNIDDLRGKRKDAIAHYRAVVDGRGASDSTVEKAKACLDRVYRGFAKDG